MIRQSASGHHAVQMRMEQQILSPGMEDGAETNLGTEPLRIASQLQQGL